MPSEDEIEKMFTDYSQWLSKFGDSPQAVGWSEKLSNRFEALLYPWLQNENFENISILDFGSGLSHLLPVLEAAGHRGEYIGVEINETLILASKKKYPKVKIFNANEIDEIPYVDLVLCAGVFNRKFSDSDQFFSLTVKKLLASARVGVSINCLSEFAHNKYEGNYYVKFFDLYQFLSRDQADGFIVDTNTCRGEFVVHFFK